MGDTGKVQKGCQTLAAPRAVTRPVLVGSEVSLAPDADEGSSGQRGEGERKEIISRLICFDTLAAACLQERGRQASRSPQSPSSWGLRGGPSSGSTSTSLSHVRTRALSHWRSWEEAPVLWEMAAKHHGISAGAIKKPGSTPRPSR